MNSYNHPVHEVIWYRYIKFRSDGSAVSLYTNATPKRFLPKYTQTIHQQSSLLDAEKMASVAQQAS